MCDSSDTHCVDDEEQHIASALCFFGGLAVWRSKSGDAGQTKNAFRGRKAISRGGYDGCGQSYIICIDDHLFGTIAS